jgi:hypothetical protein
MWVHRTFLSLQLVTNNVLDDGGVIVIMGQAFISDRRFTIIISHHCGLVEIDWIWQDDKLVAVLDVLLGEDVHR